MEWANRLTQWHDVYLHNLKAETSCSWFGLNPNVKMCEADMLWKCDCVILTSPHSSHFLKMILPHQRCFLFLQMMEHLFRPNDADWLQQCHDFYTSDRPMFSISRWNIEMLESQFGRTGKTFYIGNGVNFDEFPIAFPDKEARTVLVEGWQCSNPSKDVQNITHGVAGRLRKEGYKIIAYSGIPIRTDRHLLHEMHIKPTVQKINELYSRSTIMIKASLYDARSCSPVEAFSKHTPTARAIYKGDDDLQHEQNCLRCEYDQEQLYQISKHLLADKDLRQALASSGLTMLKKYDWNYWMNIVNETLCNGLY